MKTKIAAIIEKCLKNDHKAQKELFTFLAPKLLTVSRQYCPKTADPLDNLQDSFIKIFSSLHQYDSAKGSLETWARKIVINTSIDKINKRIIETTVSEFESLDYPENIAIEKELDAEYILQVIEKLPDGYRQVFCLFELEGYSHKEIAEILGIKESTSRSQLSRSKILLQQWLIMDQKILSLKF